MFEVSSESELSMVDNVPPLKTSTKTKKPKAKVKPKVKVDGFAGLTDLLNNWNPSDQTASRDFLLRELRRMFEAESYTCINSCVPGLIVDGKYPIEIMRYRTKDDIDEFVTRMVWMKEVFRSTIGIIVGVPDPETSSLIEDVCCSLLNVDEDCVIMIL